MGYPNYDRQGLPTIVCLCGSTRFSEAFQAANLRETLAGRIVLTIGCDMRSDDALGLPADTKAMLDELHLRKIDLADSVLVVSQDGYVGESTAREIAYAKQHGKPVRFVELSAEERWNALAQRYVPFGGDKGPYASVSPGADPPARDGRAGAQ